MATGKATALAFLNSVGLSNGAGRDAEPFATSELVKEYLVLKALASTSPMPPDLANAHDAALAAVCDGIRTRKVLLDYVPEASGCVDMPAVDHSHYMQAVLYWCAELRCPPARLVEAHARIGQFANRALLVEMLATVEREDTLPSTSFDSTFSWREAPSTIPLQLPEKAVEPESPPANLLNIRW